MYDSNGASLNVSIIPALLPLYPSGFDSTLPVNEQTLKDFFCDGTATTTISSTIVVKFTPVTAVSFFSQLQVNTYITTTTTFNSLTTSITHHKVKLRYMVAKNGIWRDGCFLQTQSSGDKHKASTDSYAIVFHNSQTSTITFLSLGSLTACKLAMDELVKLKDAQYRGMYYSSISFDGVTTDTNVMDAIHQYLYAPKVKPSSRIRNFVLSKISLTTKLNDDTMKSSKEDCIRDGETVDQQSSSDATNQQSAPYTSSGTDATNQPDAATTSEQLQSEQPKPYSESMDISVLQQYSELLKLYEHVEEYYQCFPNEYTDKFVYEEEEGSEEEEDDNVSKDKDKEKEKEKEEVAKLFKKKEIQEQYAKAVAEVNRIANLKKNDKRKPITIKAPWHVVRDENGTKYLVPLSLTTNPSSDVGWEAIIKDKKPFTTSINDKDDHRIYDVVWAIVKRTLMILNVDLESGWRWESIERIESKGFVEDIHRIEKKFVPLDSFFVHTDYIQTVNGKIMFLLS